MSKHRYHCIEFQEVDWPSVLEPVNGERLVFGVDVAKHDMVAAVMNMQAQVLVTVRWRHPQQTRAVVARLQAPGPAASVEVVLEPSGTYGDALCGQLRAAGLSVYRLSPKRVHDAAEVYDGVPSLHDAKAAALIGRLHLQGISRRWEALDEQRRELKAQLGELGWYKERQQRGRNRLEARLSRHWPESAEYLEASSVSLLELLAEYGTPARVAANRSEARTLLCRAARSGVDEQTLDGLLDSAARTVGLACVGAEQALVQDLAEDLLATHRRVRALERAVQAQVGQDAALARIGAVIGAVSAAVLWASQGDPRAYPDADSLLKSCGLNLKERSSGQHRGQLKLTKRGPGVVRFYLYFAALRLLANDACVQRWYEAKLERPGAMKGKCIVALMRKLTKALWHVARGATFDTGQLFNLKAIET